jgi:hypothetical protein
MKGEGGWTSVAALGRGQLGLLPMSTRIALRVQARQLTRAHAAAEGLPRLPSCGLTPTTTRALCRHGSDACNARVPVVHRPAS